VLSCFGSVVFLGSLLVILSFFSSDGWESWDVEHQPVVPRGMPFLVDDDVRFEDGPGAPRVCTVVNRWLRGLPSSGAAAPRSWACYARVVRAWTEFCAERGVGLFDSRERLKDALGAYAEYRAAGPLEARYAASTWGQAVSVLALFYRWAISEGFASAEPFTYRTARAMFDGTGREVRRNLAVRRTPKPHVTIKYLEPAFTVLFLRALRGLLPDGSVDPLFRGRESVRNTAVARLAVATGLRLQEFTYLLIFELPVLPRVRTQAPIPFPVPSGVAKGRKFRTTWVDYDALAEIHQYVALEHAATVGGSSWRPLARWGEPLRVSEPDARGARINGVRTAWHTLTPGERRRLIGPGGGTCLLAAKAGGGPFTAWPSVFTRTSTRIRTRFEPRFPQVNPHRLRHSFSMATLERLVEGHYRQAAQLAADTATGGGGPDAALALYLTKADPLMVLRDLLGHSSAVTTEAYLRRLDTTRIYADAYLRVEGGAALADDLALEQDARREADAEFDDDDLEGLGGGR
jgi:integrase